jgi:hypothetical protein
MGRLRLFNDKEKWCSACTSWLPLDAFSKLKREPSGRATYCRLCKKKKNQKWGYKHQKKYTHNHLYGITLEEREILWEKQNRCCGICKEPIPVQGNKSHLDHNHDTGKVRGLLCPTCNMGIGLLGEGRFLIAAIQYLEKAECT